MAEEIEKIKKIKNIVLSAVQVILKRYDYDFISKLIFIECVST